MISAVLVSCGGSSGNGSGNNNGGNTNVAPTSNAGGDQTITENTLAQLAGTGSDANAGDTLSFAWTQVTGTAVTINNANMAGANFTTPSVAADEVLVFRLTVSDQANLTSSDDVSITVVVNMPPTANAGVDQTVAESTVAQFAGSGTDPNVGDTLGFAWTQVSGTVVTINNANMAVANFTAPDVAADEVLVFRLTVSDQGNLSASDDVSVTVMDVPVADSISGVIEFQTPNVSDNCNRPDFAAISVLPIRQVTVQLIDANSNAVLNSVVSGEDGSYAFSNPGQASVFVRARAELKQLGAPAWDVEVRDNTSDTGQPLNLRPLYVLDGAASVPTGGAEIRNLLATTGWTGNAFDNSMRSAAPFAILDSIYSAMQLVLSASQQANFVPLDVFWSVNNSNVSGDIAVGELGSAFYNGGIDSLFLRGLDADDTDEFDDHVIVHEWGHYFEDTFSRSDSIGGSHAINDRLDPRLSFGEGFATALSGMALNDPIYCDTFRFNGEQRGFQLRIEDEATGNFAGWYNEASMWKVIYDLWDTDDDGADTGSIGFAPIFNVLTGSQATTDATTTIFSFIEGLNAAGTGQQALIDSILASESVTAAGIDRFGSNELNDATASLPGATDVLPIYAPIAPDSNPINICSNSQFDNIGANADGNKLGERRLLTLNIVTASRYTFNMQADAATIASLPPDDPNSDIDQSDPDLFYYRSGAIQNLIVGGNAEGFSGDANVENFTSANVIPAGLYIIDLVDFRYQDTDTDANYPPRTCFDISVTPAP